MTDLIVDFPRTRARLFQRSERRVSFDDGLAVKHVENFSLEHKSDLWFSNAEMERFKRDAPRSLRDLRSSLGKISAETLWGVDTEEFMGLEKFLSVPLAREIQLRQRRHRAAIVSEQRRQRAEGVRDAEVLAKVSEDESGWARRRARTIALLHAGKK
ncbi:hypothetical protein ACHAWF_005087 [Thalassiosira exigua]